MIARTLSERLERLRGRLLLFAPVCLGVGIGSYFCLRVEPSRVDWIRLAIGALLALLFGLWLSRRSLSGFGLPFLGLAVALSGLLLAGARTHTVAAPVLGFRYYGPVEGRIIRVDRSQSDALRLTLDQVRLEDVRAVQHPTRVRVSLHGPDGYLDPMPGMRVAMTAHLSPPGGPVEPGGFDFRRLSWFRGIGAVGYTRTPALELAPPEGALPVERLRRRIARAVADEIGGEAGAFAAAITTGDRSGMGQETVEALRSSNLAHLLAISGLHMGLLAGFVFGAVRLGLALIPMLGQSRDVRRYAAAVALAAGAFYLALSGGAVSTSRAFVMVAVMLGAILVGRRALTLRAVAVAALVLLFLRPEALVEAGFQMSFAATTALVAVFGALNGGLNRRLPGWLRPVLAVVLSSLVAGLATAPYAAAIFNRVAHYGLIANVLAVPVMGALVMPLAVVAAILWPFGLSWIALDLMRYPIGWILGVARVVAGWDGAVGHVVAPHWSVIPLISLGGLALVLLQGRGRWGGLLPVIAAFVLWSQTERPLLLISESAGLMGLAGPQGRVLSKDRGDGFTARSWLENDGDGATQEEAAVRPGFEGEPGARRAVVAGLSVIQLSGRGASDRLAAACANADVLVFAPKPPEAYPPDCDVIDRVTMRTTGSMAFFVELDGLRVVTAAERAGQRPWTDPRAFFNEKRRTR